MNAPGCAAQAGKFAPHISALLISNNYDPAQTAKPHIAETSAATSVDSVLIIDQQHFPRAHFSVTPLLKNIGAFSVTNGYTFIWWN